MRKLICLITFAGLTSACGSGSSDGPQVGTAACNTDGQKQYVLDQLYNWYLWNDLLLPISTLPITHHRKNWSLE